MPPRSLRARALQWLIPQNRTPKPYPQMARIQPDIRGHKRSQRENGEVDKSPENKGFPKCFEGFWKKRQVAFESGAFNHSATLPHCVYRALRIGLDRTPQKRTTLLTNYRQSYARIESYTTPGPLQAKRHLLAQDQSRQAGPIQKLPNPKRKCRAGVAGHLAQCRKTNGPIPKSRSQKPGCGFPVLMLVGVLSLTTGVLLDSISNGTRASISAWYQPGVWSSTFAPQNQAVCCE